MFELFRLVSLTHTTMHTHTYTLARTEHQSSTKSRRAASSGSHILKDGATDGEEGVCRKRRQ